MIGFTMPWILAHFIGDYLLQNDWMAQNKKKSNLACTIHVALYILPFLFTEANLIQLVLIFAQHWIQDRTKFVGWWCKMMGSFQTELKTPALPWGHFIVDNIFHVVWMWAVMSISF
jgi:hypothetical protein